jgi:hypothetical protein
MEVRDRTGRSVVWHTLAASDAEDAARMAESWLPVYGFVRVWQLSDYQPSAETF